MQFTSEVLRYASWFVQNAGLFVYSIPFLLMVPFACISVLVQSGRTRAVAEKRTSYDKGAKQIVLLATCIGWIVCMGCKATFAWHYGTWLPVDQETLVADLLLLAFALLVILFHIEYLLWKFLGRHGLLQRFFSLLTFCLGMSLTLVFWFGLRGVVFGVALPPSREIAAMDGEYVVSTLEALVRNLGDTFDVRTLLDPQADPTVLESLQMGTSPTVCILLCLFPLLLAMAAIFGQLGMLFLRAIHDYGRDHYSVVLTWTSAFARNAGGLLCIVLLTFLAAQGYVQWMTQTLNVQLLFSEALLFVLWLFCLVLWTVVAKSALPLRHKVWTILADMLAVSTLVLVISEWLKTSWV